MSFQQLADFGGKRGQFARQSLQIGAQKIARVAAGERRVAQVKAFPVARNALLYAGRDHLGDVAPRQRDLFAQQRHRPVLGPHLFGEVFDFVGARDERHEVEAEGVLDRAPLPSPGEAFAVRRVAPDDQPGVDETGEMPAQRRRRHAMGADRELLVGGEHDDARAGRISFAALESLAGKVSAVS